MRAPSARPAAPPDALLLPVAGAAVAALALTWLPWLSPLAYPLRLLLTVVHELSHGLAALATGGRFAEFAVFPDGSGVAYTAGGWRWVVVPAGYLGTAAFSAALVLLAAGRRASRALLGGLGLVIAALTLRYALPTLLSTRVLGGALAIVAGAGLGIAFFWISRRAAAAWVLFTLHLVAFWACLGALTDLRTLIGLSRGGGPRCSDAHTMAEIALLPPIFWALAWALVALVLVGAALYHAWLRPSRRQPPRVEV